MSHKLKYLVDDGFEQDGVTVKFKEEDLPDGYKALLKIFKTYVGFEKEVNSLKLYEDWSSINRDNFNDYRFLQECSYRVMQLGNVNAPTTSSKGCSLQYAVTTQSLKAMSADPNKIVRREWKKGIKRDASAYQNFTNDKQQWESWNRSFISLSQKSISLHRQRHHHQRHHHHGKVSKEWSTYIVNMNQRNGILS